MKVGDTKCQLCGQNVFQASERGAYLKRVNETGGSPILECRPNCDQKTGNQDDALLRALGFEEEV